MSISTVQAQAKEKGESTDHQLPRQYECGGGEKMHPACGRHATF